MIKYNAVRRNFIGKPLRGNPPTIIRESSAMDEVCFGAAEIADKACNLSGFSKATNRLTGFQFRSNFLFFA